MKVPANSLTHKFLIHLMPYSKTTINYIKLDNTILKTNN